MGYRLSKICTRTGDGGMTGLGDGTRVPKDHARVEACGQIDELGSFLGLLLAHDLEEEIRRMLTAVQHDLFDLGGELSIPGHVLLAESRVAFLEEELERLNAELPPLMEFILPGGSEAAALCHVARTVCRRAERWLVRLHHAEPVSETALRYLNRLSDLLFVTARRLNRSAGRPDVLWDRRRDTESG